jgi:hypothetical protein
MEHTVQNDDISVSPVGLRGAGPLEDPVKVELHALLPKSSGQLGEVARCLERGITDRKDIVNAGAAANTGAVGNILSTIRAIEDSLIPVHAPTVARLSASSARSFRKQHRERLSRAALIRLDDVIERLDEAAANRQAQAEEEAELQHKGVSLEKALVSRGGVYVYTYPHYYRYPTVEGTRRTLLKVGHTAADARERVHLQARQTAIPEDPLLLRVYQDPNRTPRELERDFHDLLDAADHGRSETQRAVENGSRRASSSSIPLLRS